MNAKKGFLRLSIVLSITAYIVAFLICLASIPPKPLRYLLIDDIGIWNEKKSNDILSQLPVQPGTKGKMIDLSLLPDQPETIKIYHQAQRNLIFVPLISFAGVWSLWIVYFIVLWVIKGV
jgi:hypothetical protein